MSDIKLQLYSEAVVGGIRKETHYWQKCVYFRILSTYSMYSVM